MARNPADVAQKWATNLGAAGQTITAGVNAVSVNPAATAAARQDAYLAGVQRAVSSGKYQAGLARVTLQSWKDAMIKKGIGRIASGATAAQPKMQQFMAAWLPYMDGLKSQLANMPRGDINANIQRAIATIQYNAAFPGVR